jgi:hypothetical protein
VTLLLATLIFSCSAFSCKVLHFNKTSKGKGKDFPATGLSRPLGIRKIKVPDFLDFRHYEGVKVVTLTHRPSLPPSVSWY